MMGRNPLHPVVLQMGMTFEAGLVFGSGKDIHILKMTMIH
jgi:hypothetical protein